MPGWDCHGLPIELKALEEWKSEASSMADAIGEKPTRDPLSIRAAARRLAEETIQRQKQTFREWGIMADWENAWHTMDPKFEIRQLQVFRDMVNNGRIFRQNKPVFWSPSSRTALAEAELEYRDDHVSTAAFVAFPVNMLSPSLSSSQFSGSTIHALIWTTTPWTIPANRAIGYHKDLDYALVQIARDKIVITAKARLGFLRRHLEEDLPILASLKGFDLGSFSYADSTFDSRRTQRPFLHADFVSADSGTGLVHLAPGHGVEDFNICQENGIPASTVVDDEGHFTSQITSQGSQALIGQNVLGKGTQNMLDCLASEGRLFALHPYTHSYPYDWRSKKPVLVRATEQWFTDIGPLQDAAIQALDGVQFLPTSSKARLQSFLKHRQEWCISRQRAWGVPIPALFHKMTGAAILSPDSIDHIISVIEIRGIDAWWQNDPFDPIWTPPNLREDDGQTSFLRGTDTMDVWYDSGTSWAQMPSRWPMSKSASKAPADVYLEGTDQHRGWFQSSLLTYLAKNDDTISPLAPYQTLITHGFALDAKGHKMSKSLGNVVSPQEITDGTLLPPIRKRVGGKMTEFRDAMGVDALRLWVASCDYTKDVSIGPEVLKSINSTLSKYRVTLKQLLGIVSNLDALDTPMPKDLGNPHKIAIWHVEQAKRKIRQHYEAFEYYKAIVEINRYVNQDLSAFYLECIKDAAYCGTRVERKLVQATCAHLLFSLQQFLCPVTPLLAEESWQCSTPELQHYHRLTPFRRTWTSPSDPANRSGLHIIQYLSESKKYGKWLAEEFPKILSILDSVKQTQEKARREKRMGSSLQSSIVLEVKGEKAVELLKKYANDLETFLVASSVEVCFGDLPQYLSSSDWAYKSVCNLDSGEVIIHLCAPHMSKCVRCYRYAAPTPIEGEEALCERCEGVTKDLWADKPDLFKNSASSEGLS